MSEKVKKKLRTMLKIIKLILCIFHERVKKLPKSCTEQTHIRQGNVRHYFPRTAHDAAVERGIGVPRTEMLA